MTVPSLDARVLTPAPARLVVEPPAFLTLSQLSDDEEWQRQRLVTQLRRVRIPNNRQRQYYDGSRAIRDLGIAIPPHLRDVESVIGWPETVVDVISERLRWRGWASNGLELGLSEIYDDNRLKVTSGQAVLDALIYGLAFLTVGTGDEGEPDVLVTAESPDRITGTWNARRHRLDDALTELYNTAGQVSGWTIYNPDQTIITERLNGKLLVIDRDEHGKGRVPVAVLRNHPRADEPHGRSEISRALRSHTDNGMRTILGMEVSREFYGAPQRALMGAEESMFVDEDGNPVGQWAAVIGKMLMAPRDENGDLPEPYTFQAASPQPYSDILRTLTQLVSSVTGIPAHHLGFTTDNPASEGAIARADSRLDRRAEDRQDQYDLGLLELAELCVLWRDSELPPPRSIKSRWVPVGVVAPGAAADRATKMIAAGVLQPDWDFTLEQFGLTDEEIQQVRVEREQTPPPAVDPIVSLAATLDRQAKGLPTTTAADVNPV